MKIGNMFSASVVMLLLLGPAALLPSQDKADLVLVAGGTFSMGDTDGGGESNEKPVHQVTVSSFYMARTEVTQKEFGAVMGINPSQHRGDDRPVENVTWYDAVAFCNEKSRREGLRQVYSISGIQKNGDGTINTAEVSADWRATGYRLPTEAEWEYAAKGGTKSRGYQYSGGNDLAPIAWHGANSNGETHPVGTKQPNELGLFDMSGNVWEWCWDWYGAYAEGSQTDPHGPAEGSLRVGRGGAWRSPAERERTALRFNNYPPAHRSLLLGFRPVRTQ
jgi:formylglycine-generating enzyme required for sulfatase activity